MLYIVDMLYYLLTCFSVKHCNGAPHYQDLTNGALPSATRDTRAARCHALLYTGRIRPRARLLHLSIAVVWTSSSAVVCIGRRGKTSTTVLALLAQKVLCF
jgi:hypothetical protein